MSSSMASNASASGPLNSSSGRPNASSEDDGQIPPKPPGSNDIGWNYGKLVKKNSYNEVKCNKCHKIVKGGITGLSNMLPGLEGIHLLV